MPQRQEKLPYYEINLDFDAPVVAYEKDVKGWKESVDLSKEDKDSNFQEYIMYLHHPKPGAPLEVIR